MRCDASSGKAADAQDTLVLPREPGDRPTPVVRARGAGGTCATDECPQAATSGGCGRREAADNRHARVSFRPCRPLRPVTATAEHGMQVKTLAAVLAALVLPEAARARESLRTLPETVVTATRIPTPLERIPAGVTVIDRETIERRVTRLSQTRSLQFQGLGCAPRAGLVPRRSPSSAGLRPAIHSFCSTAFPSTTRPVLAVCSISARTRSAMSSGSRSCAAPCPPSMALLP